MATCIECCAELPNHRPGCDAPAVGQQRLEAAEGRGTTGRGFVTWDAPALQPAPTGNGTPILQLVLADLQQRQEHGQKKYGTVLRAHNGRDALQDALEEAYDQVMYLRQLREEWPALLA